MTEKELLPCQTVFQLDQFPEVVVLVLAGVELIFSIAAASDL